MKWSRWNDQLSFLLVFLIACLWISAPWTHLDESVVGATIVVFTLVAQYYFRRKGPSDGA